MAKLRVKTKCEVDIPAQGHFAEGMIAMVDEDLARQMAQWNQVTILSDEDAPPPIPPKEIVNARENVRTLATAETDDTDDDEDASDGGGSKVKANLRRRRNAS